MTTTHNQGVVVRVDDDEMDELFKEGVGLKEDWYWDHLNSLTDPAEIDAQLALIKRLRAIGAFNGGVISIDPKQPDDGLLLSITHNDGAVYHDKLSAI